MFTHYDDDAGRATGVSHQPRDLPDTKPDDSAVYAVVDRSRKSKHGASSSSTGQQPIDGQGDQIDPRRAAAIVGAEVASRMATMRGDAESATRAVAMGGSAHAPAVPILPPRRPSQDLRELSQDGKTARPWLILGAGRDQLKRLTATFAEK